jgi:hypothetical protein
VLEAVAAFMAWEKVTDTLVLTAAFMELRTGVVPVTVGCAMTTVPVNAKMEMLKNSFLKFPAGNMYLFFMRLNLKMERRGK